MDMTKATASQLKAKLGQYLRAVRNGRVVVVTDRGDPVARLVPFRKSREPSVASVGARPRHPGAPPFGQVKLEGLTGIEVDTTSLLREDRNRR